MTSASVSIGSETGLSFCLDYWCLWQSAPSDGHSAWPGGDILPYHAGGADVSFLPVMQRRRLSPLAKAVCAVIWRCRHKCGDMPTVFFSNHGETQYYFEMLEGMAEREPVSPTRFSLCVHNAIAGLSSIYAESFLPYVCLAGGTEGMFGSFLEAAGMLLETRQVLVVCYEQALPKVYEPYMTTPDTTWALAMVLSKSTGQGGQLQLLREPVVGSASAENQGSSFKQSILDGRLNCSCRLERSLWRWSLNP